jgi:hypothetical protein
MDITNIELEPLSSSGSVGSPHRPPRARSVAGWVAIGLAVVATGALSVLVVRNDAGSRTTNDLTGSAQDVAVLPAASPVRPAVVTAAAGHGESAYDVCLPTVAGSADSMERFVEHCRRSLRRAAYVADKFQLCVPDGSGSADSMERWVEDCRSDIERTLFEGARTPRCITQSQVCLPSPDCRSTPSGSPDSMERQAERCALGLGAPIP